MASKQTQRHDESAFLPDGTWRPRLRPLDVQWHMHQGQPMLVLRDRLGLAQHAVGVPAALAVLLSLCDGTRDRAALRAAFELRTGLHLTAAELDGILAQLDAALLLEGPRVEEARAAALAAYRAAPFRPPALADAVYPAEAVALRAQLEADVGRGAALADGATNDALVDRSAIRGVVSPHIDYQRGGPVYGRVWSLAREAAAKAELVIAFGTDHAGSAGSWTVTDQHYATPFGVLPTARDLVAALDEIFGPAARAEELHHRAEHSLELALVWLHYMRDGRPVPVVPVIFGSFHEITQGGTSPGDDARYEAALAVLRDAMRARRTLVVVGADLAHVGPAFGDPRPFGAAECAALRTADEASLRALCAGDAAGFLALSCIERDARRVCGLPPLYFALRLLAPTEGLVVAYDQCPADAQGGSWVSIAGALLR
jgi:AmmeMemoRadiSam system protein B